MPSRSKSNTTSRGQRRPASAPRRGATAPAPPPAGLRLFNTLTRQVEPVIPLVAGRIGMYSCGPTVYRYIHIGNLRTFTMADWLRRALSEHGLDVTQIKNITDVGHMRQEVLDRGEDKLVAQALAEGKTPWEIAAFYTDAFMRDEARLHILPAHVFPRATEHIPEMIAMTQRLIERGYAYAVAGSVFFSVKAFARYGELSGNLLQHLGQGLQQGNELSDLKRAPEDFPLWKVAEPGRLMAWDSPWGRGFPGWHIECSAMSARYLGEQFDLHTGGVDNVFPHHEDERAQSEAASGKQFVRCWVHAQHLLADGLKMAKSSGNAYTLSEVEARGFEPLALRYFYTTALYRSRINFTFRALRAAQTALRRLRLRAYALYDAADGAVADSAALAAQPAHQAFIAAVDDDLNLPRAMSVIWGMLRDASLAPALRLGLLLAADRILGFDLAADIAAHARGSAAPDGGANDAATASARVAVPEAVWALAREREQHRAARAYPAADALRARIHAAGFAVRDMRAGPLILPRGDEDALISGARDVPTRLREPDQHAFSVTLLAHNSRADLERCITSVARHAGGQDVELVIVDNGSTDDTLAYLRQLGRAGTVDGVTVRVLLADHDLGFAAGRNASFNASLGRIVVQLDTSIELAGDIWTPIAALLADPTIGVVGPYGLVTDDLKEFQESAGPDVDAIEGYLMAFRRATLLEVGPADEKFRFYRLMDIDYSFEFKKAGYRAVASAAIAERVIKHPHREWYSLSEDERATKSKRNFDIYRARRHHCQSLLVANYREGQAAPWGHDHEVAPPGVVDPRFDHGAHPAGQPHTHEHKHWSDHAHTHEHEHLPAPRWFASASAAATST
ncbi:MAG TPA: cysteine--tRNA ligase, partial [Ktedonobacterales bacterium]|nr:cysteine--tRNA ligase [Ktedonobacterales bacterium]